MIYNLKINDYLKCNSLKFITKTQIREIKNKTLKKKIRINI